MLPKGWRKMRLADVVSRKISYGIVQAGPHVNNGIPYIKSSNVRDDISLLSLQRTSMEIHRKYIRSSVHPGDIVFCLRGDIGATCIVPPEISEANLTQGTARIACNEQVYSRFLIQELRTLSCVKQATNLSKGSTFKEISLESLRTIKVVIPPLPEQKKIAAILSTWDRAIEVTEQILANSQQQKKALMQQLLTGKKRLPGFTGEWRHLHFEAIFYTSNRKETQIQASDYKSVGYVPIIDQGKEFISGYTDNSFFCKDVPVIIFGDHTRIIKWVDFPFAPGADGTQVLRTKSGVDVKLGYYLLQNAKIPNLGYSRHMKALKEQFFHIPTLPEQTAIASVLTKADEEVTLFKSDLCRLRQEKKALMQQLLTGKRRVKIEAEAG